MCGEEFLCRLSYVAHVYKANNFMYMPNAL